MPLCHECPVVKAWIEADALEQNMFPPFQIGARGIVKKDISGRPKKAMFWFNFCPGCGVSLAPAAPVGGAG